MTLSAFIPVPLTCSQCMELENFLSASPGKAVIAVSLRHTEVKILLVFRLNAIFGGTFILGPEEAPLNLLIKENSEAAVENDNTEEENSSTVRGVVTSSGKTIDCDYLVIDSSYAPMSMLPAFVKTKKFLFLTISLLALFFILSFVFRTYLRGILITNRRIDPKKDSSVDDFDSTSNLIHGITVFELVGCNDNCCSSSRKEVSSENH